MKNNNLDQYSDWVKVWSGRWSLLSDYNFGWGWVNINKILGKAVYPRIIYLHKGGITDCWVRMADKNNLGKRLLRIIKDVRSARSVADSLKDGTKDIFNFLSSHNPKNISKNDYLEFWNLVNKFYLPTVSVKYVVDYLSANQLKKILPILEEARLYAEPVFRETENFVENIAKDIARKNKYQKEQILALTRDEMLKYLDKGLLPSQSVLAKRSLQSAIIFNYQDVKLVTGNGFKKIEKIVIAGSAVKEIKGQIAHRGRVVGAVRIVLDPYKMKIPFKKGEILVTGMTRPEFLPIMKKAVAFITDAGGILSHAAIVARELKKPCVIGTHIATRSLKNGDFVEVDADKGVVRIIKK